MTPSSRIDQAERRMLEADNRADRVMWCEEFLAAIRERNEQMTTAELEQLEREKGLRA